MWGVSRRGGPIGPAGYWVIYLSRCRFDKTNTIRNMVLEPYGMRHGLLHYNPDVEVPADCAITVLGTSTVHFCAGAYIEAV